MSGVIVSLPPWAGPNDQLAGSARAFTTLAEPRRAQRLEARLNTPALADVTVTVADTTPNLVVLTIPAGSLHASLAVDLELAAGELTVQTDGADGASIGFSGSLWLADVGGAPTAGAPLVSLAELLVALGSPTTTAVQDAWLTRQLNVYSERIRDYCGTHITRRRYLETHDNPGTVITREAPIQVIHSATASGQSLDVSTLRLDLEAGLISPESSIGWHSYDPLELDYEAGYDACPATIAELIFSAIGERWEAYQGGELNPQSPGLVKRETIADAGTVEYALPNGLGSTVAADFLLGFPLSALDAYRRFGHVGVSNVRQFWELA